MQPASAANQPIIEASVGSLAAGWITRMMPEPADSRPLSTQPFGLPAQLDAWAHHVPIVFGGAKFALQGADVRSCRAENSQKIDIPSASAHIGELSGKWLSHLLLRNSVPTKQIACTRPIFTCEQRVVMSAVRRLLFGAERRCRLAKG